LLYRKRWALLANRRVALIGTIFGVLAFLPGVVLASIPTLDGFVVPLLAHLTFLVNGISLYLLTRREVDALF